MGVLNNLLGSGGFGLGGWQAAANPNQSKKSARVRTKYRAGKTKRAALKRMDEASAAASALYTGVISSHERDAFD